MAYNRGNDPGHVRWGPYEHIYVLGKKLLEFSLLVGRKIHTDPKNSFWMMGDCVKQLGFLLGPAAGVSDPMEESGSWLSPLCDCYYIAICFCSFSVGRSSSETGSLVFNFQPDFFLTMAEMVLNMTWFPLISVIPGRVGYCTS